MRGVVECGTHGDSWSAYVCKHTVATIRDRKPRGFIWLRDDNGCLCAYCDECENILYKFGGDWNDQSEAFASVTLVCEACALVAAGVNGVEIDR